MKRSIKPEIASLKDEAITDRERRLWLGALAVVVAIWSTLGLAGTLVEVLRDRELLDTAFLIGFLSTMAAIAVGAFKTKPTGRELWALIGIATVYAMVIVRMGIPLAERTHLFEYGLVAVLVHQALTERFRNRSPGLLKIAALAWSITAVLGWIDEGIQALLPDRVHDLRDVFFNALAASMTIGASLVLAALRPRHTGDEDRAGTP